MLGVAELSTAQCSETGRVGSFRFVFLRTPSVALFLFRVGGYGIECW